MSHTLYHTPRWLALDRSGPCAVAELLGGECAGPIHRHHVHPVSLDGDPEGMTVQVCRKHHPMLEALARKIYGDPPGWKRCPHPHRTRAAREQCERRLNGAVAAA
jgi:hypothetical protein